MPFDSLSVAFFPPVTEYRPLESVVARNPVGWDYQLYFSNEDADEEIGRNVRSPFLTRRQNIHGPFPKIPLFYKIVFHTGPPGQAFGLPQNLRRLSLVRLSST
jgi:hypothetical protein